MHDNLPPPDAEAPDCERTRYAEYDRFASIYNKHFGQFARRVVPALDRLLLCHLPERARILDLCCGTGQLAGALTKRGFAVTGVDGSAEMLHIARQNAPGANFILEDARTLGLPATFHAAVSTFDSINHIVHESELATAFANVYQALRPGGLFAFDLNMEEGYRCRWWGTWHGTDDGDEYAIRAIYCPESRLGRNVVTWKQTGTHAETEISFDERCYSEPEVRDALTAAGFQAICVYDGHRDLDLIGEIGRSFFVCRKPEAGTAPPEPEWLQAADGARRQHRRIETCASDALWPSEAVQRELGNFCKRLQALEQVLCTLPPEPYARLLQPEARFDWFIPSDLVLGQVHPFRATLEQTTGGPHARVVYLSPLLEQQDWSVVVTVVVHELAHVILGHRLVDLDPGTYRQQEEAAQAAVRAWGFQPDADQATAHCLTAPLG